MEERDAEKVSGPLQVNIWATSMKYPSVADVRIMQSISGDTSGKNCTSELAGRPNRNGAQRLLSRDCSLTCRITQSISGMSENLSGLSVNIDDIIDIFCVHYEEIAGEETTHTSDERIDKT